MYSCSKYVIYHVLGKKIKAILKILFFHRGRFGKFLRSDTSGKTNGGAPREKISLLPLLVHMCVCVTPIYPIKKGASERVMVHRGGGGGWDV